jgi:hypothetical protein
MEDLFELCSVKVGDYSKYFLYNYQDDGSFKHKTSPSVVQYINL